VSTSSISLETNGPFADANDGRPCMAGPTIGAELESFRIGNFSAVAPQLFIALLREAIVDCDEATKTVGERIFCRWTRGKCGKGRNCGSCSGLMTLRCRVGEMLPSMSPRVCKVTGTQFSSYYKNASGATVTKPCTLQLQYQQEPLASAMATTNNKTRSTLVSEKLIRS
jgi:hypothetical protein